jgi:hypothetical protein
MSARVVVKKQPSEEICAWSRLMFFTFLEHFSFYGNEMVVAIKLLLELLAHFKAIALGNIFH